MNIQLSAAQIVDAVGGSDNIAGVTHCATRLRFEIRDTEKIRQDELKAIDGVLGVNMAGSQCQVIIGGDVVKFYPVVTKILGTDVTAAPAPKQAKGVKGGLMAILDYIAGTMTPLIPALIGCSMIRGIIVFLAQFHILDAASSTYAILNAASNGIFTFLPILAAFSAAKKLDVNPFIAACIAAALIDPSFSGLLTETGNIVRFFGIPVAMFNYSASLIPALLSTWMYSIAWKWLQKKVPTSIAGVLNPTICLIVFVPLTAIVFGPIAYWFGEGIGLLFDTLNNLSPVIAGIVVGVSMMYVTITGLHWVVTALCLTAFAAVLRWARCLLRAIRRSAVLRFRAALSQFSAVCLSRHCSPICCATSATQSRWRSVVRWAAVWLDCLAQRQPPSAWRRSLPFHWWKWAAAL